MKVLVVSTQFPSPPRSGFEMRVYQLMLQLAAKHQVTLLSFVDDDEARDASDLAKDLHVRVVRRAVHSVGSKRRSQLFSLGADAPYACRELYSCEMQEAINELCSSGTFDVIQLESPALFQYRFPAESAIVLDEHNIEHELFKRLYQSERSVLRRFFNFREHRRYRRFEQAAWTSVDGCAVTSAREVGLVHEVAPQLPVEVVPNGVDLELFRNSAETQPQPRTVVFNGVLDYRPNFDAALFLVNEVWPHIRLACPDARLTIVGRTRRADVRALRQPGVMIVGEVPDVRPYLTDAAVVVVPIRMGGGTRLKIVEALALAKPVVSTSVGAEGIAVQHESHLLIADEPQAFAANVLRLFADAELGLLLGSRGRQLVEERYSWDDAGARLLELYRCVQSRRRFQTAESLAQAEPLA
jgi:sugar transferase (PEP-CTERM/EpsH1 system associated)